MRPAADPAIGATAGWLALLAVTLAAGLAMPPAGAAIAALAAAYAHTRGQRRLRTAFIVLAVAWLVMTVLTGAVLMSVSGGGSATAG